MFIWNSWLYPAAVNSGEIKALGRERRTEKSLCREVLEFNVFSGFRSSIAVYVYVRVVYVREDGNAGESLSCVRTIYRGTSLSSRFFYRLIRIHSVLPPSRVVSGEWPCTDPENLVYIYNEVNIWYDIEPRWESRSATSYRAREGVLFEYVLFLPYSKRN